MIPMHSLTKKVMDTIIEYGLIKPHDAVFVAFSGGADSTFLLYTMMVLREQLGYRSLTALHLHHGLRGEEADNDECFVREICADWNIPLLVKRVDTKAEALCCHESIEESGRRLRYQFFEEAMAEAENAKLATAHHADDQAETMLMNMFRGCGLKGVIGIPLRRENIVRPLLFCRAEEIREFCQGHSIPFVVDKSNFSLDYTRNRVRHNVMSSVENIFPDAVSSLSRLSKLAKDDNDFLENTAKALLRSAGGQFPNVYNIGVFSASHKAVVKRAIRLAAEKAGASHLEFSHIENAIAVLENGGACNLTRGVVMVCDHKSVSFIAPKCGKACQAVNLEIGAPVRFGLNTYIAECISRDEYEKVRKVNKNLFNFSIAYDMIKGGITLRSRCEGDAFRPYNRQCTKSLKKWFNEQRIPPFLRDEYPVLSDDNGVLCLLGLAVDERAAVSKHTKQILVLKTLNEKDCE